MLHANIEARREVYAATHRIDYASSREDSAIDATRHTFAAALSNELLLGGEALSLVAGLRGEYIGDAGASSRSWTPLMPSLGALWRATPWLKLKGNIAQTFRAPDFDELYLDMAGVRGRNDLAPERALSWDGGVELGADASPISAEFVWFQSAIAESIYFVARTAYLFEAANLGSGHSRGVEATARLFAQADWRSRVYLDSFANLYNPPFWTVDLGASLAPIKGWEVALNARNLGDQQRGADSLQRPLPGRAFYVSLKLRYETLE